MTLEGKVKEVLKPVVKFEVIRGPQDFTGELLERNLMSFQYMCRNGRGQFPQFNMEFDNSSGRLWNLCVFAVGATLKIRWGYDGYMSRPYLAPISTVKAYNMAQPGMAAMNTPRPDVYGTVAMQARVHDWRTHWRVGEEVHACFSNITLSEAIKRIARSYGYPESKIFVQSGLGIDGSVPEPVGAVFFPTGMTFARFLKTKARERGFIGDIRHGEVHFHHERWRAIGGEDITYFIGPDLLSFSVEGDYSLNTQKVTSKSVDPYKGKTVSYVTEVVPNPGNQQGQPVGKAVTGVGMYLPVGKGGGQQVPSDPQAPHDTVVTLSKKGAESALRRLLSHVVNRWAINITVVGNPGIYVGCNVNLSNFGPAVDGSWIASEVEHRINTEGYTTVAKLKHKRKGVQQEKMLVYIKGPNGEVIGIMMVLGGNYEYKKSDKKNDMHKVHDRAGRRKNDPLHAPNRTLRKPGESHRRSLLQSSI